MRSLKYFFTTEISELPSQYLAKVFMNFLARKGGIISLSLSSQSILQAATSFPREIAFLTLLCVCWIAKGVNVSKI